MKYIVGDRITTDADKHDLSVRQRLVLMTRVCDAVHHAHEMDDIHRDLKPANILIAATVPDSGRFDSRTVGTGGSTTLEVTGQPEVWTLELRA